AVEALHDRLHRAIELVLAAEHETVRRRRRLEVDLLGEPEALVRFSFAVNGARGFRRSVVDGARQDEAVLAWVAVTPVGECLEGRSAFPAVRGSRCPSGRGISRMCCRRGGCTTP